MNEIAGKNCIITFRVMMCCRNVRTRKRRGWTPIYDLIKSMEALIYLIYTEPLLGQVYEIFFSRFYWWNIFLFLVLTRSFFISRFDKIYFLFSRLDEIFFYFSFWQDFFLTIFYFLVQFFFVDNLIKKDLVRTRYYLVRTRSFFINSAKREIKKNEIKKNLVKTRNKKINLVKTRNIKKISSKR